MGRKNLERYTGDDWRAASGSIRNLLANGWPVYAECDLCGVRLRAEVERIAQIAGSTSCPRGASPAA